LPILGMNEPLNPLPSARTQQEKRIDEEKLKKACADFEAIFIQQLFKSMRQTVPKGGLLGEGPGMEIYQSLFDQELSKSLASHGRLGLGGMIYRQKLQQEERKHLPPVELKAFDRGRRIVSRGAEE
jgi:peptidoglycan hydrolase FlgJ